ncbi:MAG: hypothetical protein ABSF18_05125 [Gammaproteobacteria bacterium]|jgi:hypothetical protein
MKQSILKLSMLAALIPVAVFAADTNTSNAKGNGPTVQILMEGNPSTGFKPIVVNSRGEKTGLTLATFLDAIAETWITGTAQPTPQDKLDPKAVSYIRIDRKGDTASAMLYDFPIKSNPFRTNRNEPATLGVLLGQAAQAAPGCTPAQINGKTVDLKLTFKTDAQGHVNTFFTDPKTGKEEAFNLGVMMANTTALLNDCK